MANGLPFSWKSRKIVILFLLAISSDIIVAPPGSIIDTLPGYSGVLPFKLETGYISVGEKDEIQLFYYFFSSEGNPATDPLMIWFTGGPGCSGLAALVENKGPLAFTLDSLSHGNLPTLVTNPYTLTKVASIIFIDSPVKAGFSYATMYEGYNMSDTKSAEDATTFLKKWLLDHPEFDKNPLYICGDSYAGLIVPMVVFHIAEAIEDGQMPNTNLQGYMLGNPLTDAPNDVGSRVPYANRMALISDQYYEWAKTSCQGDYSRQDSSNTKCLLFLDLIDKCIEGVYFDYILGPKCRDVTTLRSGDEFILRKQSSQDMILLSSSQEEHPEQCAEKLINHITEIWANKPVVQQALHVRKGTLTSEWKRCNYSDSNYIHDMPTTIEYHRILSKKAYRVLVYSGDHDMTMPYVGTLAWIHKLNLSMDEYWRPWLVDNQVAGFTEKYRGKNGFSLTFGTIKGAGHVAARYKPKETSTIIERWLSHRSL